MSKVYVVNLSNKDFSEVEGFGDTVFMTEGILDLKKCDYYEKVFNRFLNNATDEDYLLFSGPAVICGLAVKVWFHSNIRTKCQVLTWNKTKSKYNLNVI